MDYRPLSVRDAQSDAFDALHEGVPDWLRAPLTSWLDEYFQSWDYSAKAWSPRRDKMMEFQIRMRLRTPLNWSSPELAHQSLMGRFRGTEGAPDILDYVLRHPDDSWRLAKRRASVLEGILREGGSVWEVTELPEQKVHALTRRALGPIREAVEDVSTRSERSAAHLQEAWVYLAGRHPVPDQAYFHAVLAVEAAAKSAISPADKKATLGKMIGQVRAAPERWVFTLGDPLAAIDAADLLWKLHRRHGTDDREAPMGMTQEEADAGVHLALTLARWFAGGAFRSVQAA